MAQQIVVRLIDDLDQSEAAGTVKFAFEGVHYEIDLSDSNRAKFEAQMEQYIKAARRTGGRQVKGSKTKSKASQIREWASGQGLDVGPTGKIPKDVVEAYDKANAA